MNLFHTAALGSITSASIVPDGVCKPYPREELEEMLRRWLQACADAETQGGDWSKTLAPFYGEDATYQWNVGPHENFIARGKKEILDVAVGYQMKGFEAWSYPYHDLIIDEKRGTVIGFWRQISPHKRADGSPIVIEGLGGSWFQYAGNYQWAWQHDFFDFGNAKDVFFELAGMGKLQPEVKEKIHRQAKGDLLPGHVRIRPAPSIGQKIRNFSALVKVALLGK